MPHDHHNQPAVIANLRAIVRDHQARHLDPVTGRRSSKRRGILVDDRWAHAVLTVFDGLSPEHQVNLASRPVAQMLDIAFKVLARARAAERRRS